MFSFERSALSARVAPSATIAITQKARDLKAAGRDNIISLSIGEPDFDTPDHVIQAAHRAALAGQTRYPPVPGMPVLREAIVDKFSRENGLTFSPEQVIVSHGAKQVISNAMLATLNPGDETLIPAPYWVSYPQLTQLCGATPIVIPTTADTGYILQPADLERAITPRTRWLFLNSPCNPSGAVLDRAALQALADVLRRHPHVMVLCDDIYEHLTYGETEFTTLLQVAPDLADRTLVVNGVSKAYAMTGWRIGYAAGPLALIRTMSLIQSQLTGGAGSVSQQAAVAALSGPQDVLASRRESFRQRRDRVVQALNAAPGLQCRTPQGAFYAFPSCQGVLGKTAPNGRRLDTDQDFAEALLDVASVAVVHGSAFGAPGAFRVSYAAAQSQLDDACGRIRDFCDALKV